MLSVIITFVKRLREICCRRAINEIKLRLAHFPRAQRSSSLIAVVGISAVKRYEANRIMTGLFDDGDSEPRPSTYLLRPQLTFGSLPRHLPLSRGVIMDLYGKLLTRSLHYLVMKRRVSARALMETSLG